ncbi:MAG TPA: flagellar hook basal-body protein [Rhodanobacter sp.]
MSDTLQAIGRALSADIEGLNTISHNVANVSTPGFRAVRAVPDFSAALGVQNRVQLSDGALSQTGRSYDLALRGPGFFVVDRDGQPVLVRSGGFHQSASGYLVDAQGDSVLSADGPVSVPDGKFVVDETGAMSVDGRDLGNLQIVDVAQPERLVMVEGGYRYDGEMKEWTGRVAQGAVESSNVDPAEQTLGLIELTRHAESLQHAYSIYDQVLDNGINHLGDN